MRPLRLLLDGFGCYRQPTEADFSDVDFFALTGPTGSGKSTVIDGLCFALYSTVPRWGRENAIAQALAPAASACRVGLVFEAGGKRYAVVRALGRDKRGVVHTREARLDLLDRTVPAQAPLDEILAAAVGHLAEGPDLVKAKVQDILGLSYEHFTQSVLLPQGRFSDFLQAEPRKRQDLLVELLAFGVYEKVGQRARERARLAADRVQVAQRERDELAAATVAEEERAAARVQELEGLGPIVDGQLRALGQRGEEVRQALQQAQAAREESGLLAAIRIPAEVAGLADRLARAATLVTACKKRADETAKAEQDAERARDALPEKSHTEAMAGAYERHRTLTAHLQRQQAELDTALAAETRLAGELDAAKRAAVQASAAREAANRTHAAYALADALQVGERCPVCLQPVSELPHHPTPPGLEAARAAAEAAEKKAALAQKAHAKAGNAVAAAEATANGTRSQLEGVQAMLTGAPGEAEVASTLDAIDTADEALRGAREAVRARGRDLAAAEKERADLAGEESAAWADLRRARDSVVPLGAPVITEGDLAAAWQALVTWTAQQHAARREQLESLAASAASLQEQFAAEGAALASLLAEHGITGITDPAKAPAAVAESRIQAINELRLIRRDRERAAKLDEQIRANRETEQVANELGRLLRATSFERWLCSEALDSLVAEASATLMELSGGQYQLDRDDRNDLVVIDFEDAGAIRPVHTLSGGETFQASLALALALSRQVVQLSAGLRDLNSMFLDEGFGTLDPESLDTVATTLERLAADKDRMVGLVTHVTALAERVPVRFVVSRDGATSTLRKEQV
jgi:DNA repair protein SbcC/Rad50